MKTTVYCATCRYRVISADCRPGQIICRKTGVIMADKQARECKQHCMIGF